MSINKLSLNYTVFTYLGTRWISRRSCSMPRQASLVFNNDVKVLFEAKLHVIRTGQFFEPVGLHICMMSLILYFLSEQNKNNNLYDIWMWIQVLRYLYIGPPSLSNHQAQACVGHFLSILALVALDVSESLIKFLNTLVDVPKLI